MSNICKLSRYNSVIRAKDSLESQIIYDLLSKIQPSFLNFFWSPTGQLSYPRLLKELSKINIMTECYYGENTDHHHSYVHL
jgi:hypothetical protein